MARRAFHEAAYPELWDFPGSHVEPGENLESALVREPREEIGVEATAYGPLCEISDLSLAAGGAVAHHLFLVTDWTGGELFLANDEHSVVAWMPADLAEPIQIWHLPPIVLSCAIWNAALT